MTTTASEADEVVDADLVDEDLPTHMPGNVVVEAAPTFRFTRHSILAESAPTEQPRAQRRTESSRIACRAPCTRRPARRPRQDVCASAGVGSRESRSWPKVIFSSS